MVLWKQNLQCQECMRLLPIETLISNGVTVFCSQEHLDTYKDEVGLHPMCPNGNTQVQIVDLPLYIQNILAGETGLFFLRAD